MEQVKGIEPSCSAWEADILPLNYTCVFTRFLLSIAHSFPYCKQKIAEKRPIKNFVWGVSAKAHWDIKNVKVPVATTAAW